MLNWMVIPVGATSLARLAYCQHTYTDKTDVLPQCGWIDNDFSGVMRFINKFD